MRQIKTLAIITARSGSKRIPRKNIKPFLGRPIIYYPIDVALNSELFDEVMVSTDDYEIADIARKYGASVPFMRSEKTANDFAGTADVLVEVLEEYGKKGINPEYCCCIYPTAVFISGGLLKKGFDLLKEKNFDVVFPVAKYNFSIYRALKLENGKVFPIWKEYYDMRSQDLEPAYHDTGQFYWFHVDKFMKNKTLMTENTGAILVSESDFQDIDTEEDWRIAELKYKIVKGL
ncbi:pseudaminic acid cytidylyltransferase [Thermodesulfovibrio sp.]|uniref:pseudaminic acid cytidylyltransferase n=1 Tax=Thermodesulfovibrio sp. TaxID=2067987 RepID=UPI0030A6AA41